jgi:hypothetical protein
VRSFTALAQAKTMLEITRSSFLLLTIIAAAGAAVIAVAG